MAQVKFYRGTGAPKTTDGAISINTSNGRVYLGNGSSAKELGVNPSNIVVGDTDKSTQLSSDSLDFYDAGGNSILSLARADESCRLNFDNTSNYNYIDVDDTGEAYLTFNNSPYSVDLTTNMEGSLVATDDSGTAKLFCEGTKSSVYLYRKGPYTAELKATTTDQSVNLSSTVGGTVKLDVPVYSSSTKGRTGGLTLDLIGGTTIKFGVCTYTMELTNSLTSGTTTTVTYPVPGLVMSASTPQYLKVVPTVGNQSISFGSPTIKSIGVSGGKIVTNVSFTAKPNYSISSSSIYASLQFCGIYY